MIDTLLQRHEEFKKKWLRLSLDDLFQWNMLLEEMMDKKVELTSEYMEDKAKNEVEEWLRFIDLQNETIEIEDKKWEKKLKNKYTVDSAKAVLWKEFYEKRQDLKAKKLQSDLLWNKIACISEYIQLAKRNLPV